MFKSINKVTKLIIISDFFLNSAWGFLAPVFAIFLVQSITYGNNAEGAKIAGFATLFYWLTKALLQIPIGHRLDKNHGEEDDYSFMILGMIVTAFVPIGYFFSHFAWHIYLAEIIHAVGMSMFVPAYYAIFTRHIDKGREAFEWSLDSTVLGLGIGISGALGGLTVAFFGFKVIFILTTLVNLISIAFLLAIKKNIFKKNHEESRVS